MLQKSKIFVAGGTGMVGSAIIRNLRKSGFTNLVGSYHSSQSYSRIFAANGELEALPDQLRLVKLDLTRQDEVESFFKTERPDYVFLAAAKVGGIKANSIYPAQFIHDNLTIQNNVIHAAYRNRVKRLLFLGSSCIYPKFSPQPMKEEHLLSGYLEPTNEPYAIAKIAGIKMCEAYNRQYGTRFMAVMPTNLYGTNDNFDLETSHVLPALIRKFHEGKISGNEAVAIWGSGKPRREFLHVDDMAEASVFVMNLGDDIASYYKFVQTNLNVLRSQFLTVWRLQAKIWLNLRLIGCKLFHRCSTGFLPLLLHVYLLIPIPCLRPSMFVQYIQASGIQSPSIWSM